jgi:hypothetical protein
MAPFLQLKRFESGVGVGSGVGVPPGVTEASGAAEVASWLAEDSGEGLGAADACAEATGDAPPSD